MEVGSRQLLQANKQIRTKPHKRKDNKILIRKEEERLENRLKLMANKLQILKPKMILAYQENKENN